jgi:hypothetical protein
LLLVESLQSSLWWTLLHSGLHGGWFDTATLELFPASHIISASLRPCIMSLVMPNGGEGTSDNSPVAGHSSQPQKPARVLACVLCQQRKVKCDRKFPCANCIRLQVQCVPAALVRRQRKRRFPERELLDRLRKYENLLRQNHVKFEPLHKDPAVDKDSPNTGTTFDSDEEKPEGLTPEASSPLTRVKSEREYEAKYVITKEHIRSAMSSR